MSTIRLPNHKDMGVAEDQFCRPIGTWRLACVHLNQHSAQYRFVLFRPSWARRGYRATSTIPAILRRYSPNQTQINPFQQPTEQEPMARAKPPATVSKAIPMNEAVVQEEMSAANTLALLERAKQGHSQGRDLVNQLLGQAQAFQASANLLQTFGVSKLAIVKETKLYQQLKGMRAPNGLELSGTWVEFCELLGISDEKANQDISNLKAFGEVALEQMQRVGISYRDMRQFRRLPADQKNELIEAAKAGDTETLLELAEELIAKHIKEKAAMAGELLEAKQEHAATEQRLQVVNEQKEKAEKAAALIAVMPPDEKIKALQHAATLQSFAAQAAVRGMLRQSLIALRDHDENDRRKFMQGLVDQVKHELNGLYEEFALDNKIDHRPEFVIWSEEQDALKGVGDRSTAST